MEKKKETNKHAKKQIPIFQKILLIIFIIIFIVSGFILGRWYYNTSQTEKKYIDLAKEVAEETTENKESTIHFEELKQINADVVGWIKIDNTTIDYPILQTTNNDYYLKKDIYKEYDQCGSIFMDYKNQSNFTDKNTVIYGHHIKKGIMFADLVNIYNGKLGNDVKIYVYTPDKTMIFEVFSSYQTEPENYSINTAITENELHDFIKVLKERSEKEFIGKYENTDKILTLSTCDSTGKKRVLVHAALVEIK